MQLMFKYEIKINSIFKVQLLSWFLPCKLPLNIQQTYSLHLNATY